MTPDGSAAAEPLAVSALKQIDKICDQFEAGWHAGLPGDVADYLTHLEDAPGPRARQELLCQLIVLDLEYRWRTGKVEGLPTAAVPCRLEDYEARFPDLGKLPVERRIELIAAEFRARQKWGDGPGYEEYSTRFPHLGPELKTALHATAAELTPTAVKIYHDQQLMYSTRLTLPLEIGRQRPGEPQPYCRIEAGDKDRLVIAPAGEKKVSRVHLYLEIAAKDELRLTNRSAKNAVAVNSGERLAPGRTCHVQRPALITVGGRIVRLDARSND